MGWFIYKSEIIPTKPDLGNTSVGMRKKGSGILSEPFLYLIIVASYTLILYKKFYLDICDFNGRHEATDKGS